MEKTKRQQTRSQRYRQLGLLEFEIKEVMENEGIAKAPYFDNLISDRVILAKLRKKNGWSDYQYNRQVAASYRSKLGDNYAKGRIRKLKFWDLLRTYEDKYKDKAPQYETPTVKKTPSIRKFNYDALVRAPKKQLGRY